VKRLVVAMIAASATAHAQPKPDAPPPAVDVQDLPPLPAADEGPSTSATVLAASAAEEDVVVGAAKREQSLGNVASAVTVISADRIRRFGYRTVGEAVAGVAGAYVEDNRLVSSIGIRGINIPGDFNTRILVLVDGATINEAWGAFAGIGYDTFVSIDDIARIEVIRGPVSSVYGANAFFGIINIVTRGAAETPAVWGRTSINSVNGSITSAGFAQGGLHQQLRGTVSVMDRIGDTSVVNGIGDPGSELKGDGAQSYAASLAGTYNGTFAQVRAYRYRRDSPFAPYNGDPTDPTPYYQYDTQLLAEVGHTHELSENLSVTARVYANIYRFEDHIIQVGDAPFDDFGDAQTYGAEVRGRYEIIKKRLGVTAGTEANYNITKSRAFTECTPLSADPTTCGEANGAIIPKNFNLEGAYAELDGTLTDWFGFTGGLRYDRNSVIDTRLSPRAALFFSKPEKYGLKLLYAEGFRNPSAFEAFFFDNTSFAQPVALHAETIRSFETVLWAKPVPGLSTRLSAYYWDAKGIVTQLPCDPNSSQICMDNPTLLQFQNVGEIVSLGLEAEASYRNSRGWYAFAGAAYTDVGQTDVTTGNIFYGTVPNAPVVTAAGGVSTPKLFGIGHLSTELTFIGARPTRPDDDTGTALPESRAWLGWNAVIYVPNVHGFDMTLGVRNIIGHRDQVPAPGDYDRTNTDDAGNTSTTTIARVPGEGREFFAKLGYSY
jgi:outer membrane receptor for ferrienterochelin and colicins